MNCRKCKVLNESKTSASKTLIKCHLVAFGILLQLLLAIFILKLNVDFKGVSWFGDRINGFFAHTHSASAFMLGVNFKEHGIANT